MKKIASIIAISLSMSFNSYAQSIYLYNEDGSVHNNSIEIYCGLPFTKTLSSAPGTTLSNQVFPFPEPAPKAPFINSTNISANSMRFYGTAPSSIQGSPIIGSLRLELKSGTVVLQYYGIATWLLERADTDVAPSFSLNLQPETTINISDEIRSRYPFATNALNDLAVAKTRVIGVTGGGIRQENGDFVYTSSESGGENISASYIVSATASIGTNCTHRAESTIGSIFINVANKPTPEIPETPTEPGTPSNSLNDCIATPDGAKIIFRFKCKN